jgi:hypothetical protein
MYIFIADNAGKFTFLEKGTQFELLFNSGHELL